MQKKNEGQGPNTSEKTSYLERWWDALKKVMRLHKNLLTEEHARKAESMKNSQKQAS